jgi:hypothetical protein
MLSLKERLKSSLWVLGFFLLLGGIMDGSVNLLSFVYGHSLVILWMPIFLLGYLVIFVASLFKYGYDFCHISSNEKHEEHA